MIPFNKPVLTGNELININVANKIGKFSGDGLFTKKCHKWLEKNIKTKKALLTHSCTSALEMSALLLDLKKGDEIIMPSYTFVSTANAFVLMGAKPVFIDISLETLCIDENLIEKNITNKTKAIVVVDYAGVSCDYTKIISISKKYKIPIIEDAAQGILSEYKKRKLGSIGALGCMSFHETKNITCGEGGALLINDMKYYERALSIREKGTNRTKFILGTVDKYTWVSKGSSYLPGELSAAFLSAQLESSRKLTKQRINIWKKYHKFFLNYEKKKIIRRPIVPKYNKQNGHMYYILFNSKYYRDWFMNLCNKKGLNTVFHYIPLHSSPAGKKFGKTLGPMKNTNFISNNLLRLPLWIGIEKELNKIFQILDDSFDVISK